MWIAIIIALVIFIIRTVYINSGTYAVIDKIGFVWASGSYKQCKNWIKIDGNGDFHYYTIKRVTT